MNLADVGTHTENVMRLLQDPQRPFQVTLRGNQNSNVSIFHNETNKITGIYKLSARYINVRYFNGVIY
jgi:hypothetical protein